ncbi:MAG: putative metal-binding motif-containing protein [Candidatus Heimdallarchaeaceae archaeon]
MKSFNVSLLFVLFISLFGLIMGSLVTAFPPIPYIVHGNVYSDGTLVPKGAEITAIDSDSTLCGTAIMPADGEYWIYINGDDSETTEEEGANEGDVIKFMYDGKYAIETIVWKSGKFNYSFNLNFNSNTCSDCDNDGYDQAIDCKDENPQIHPGAPELCNNIDDDCDGSIDEELTRVCGSSVGECKQGTQTCSSGVWSACTGEIAPKTEECNNVDDDCDGVIDEGCSTGGGNSNGGTGGSTNGGTTSNTTNNSDENTNTQENQNNASETQSDNSSNAVNESNNEITEPEPCKEAWSCSGWTSCIEGLQTRTCIDSNNCGTEKNKPGEELICGCRPQWFCKPWSKCINGTQERFCLDAQECNNNTALDQKTQTRNCSILTQDLGPAVTGNTVWKEEWTVGIIFGVISILAFVFFKWLK